MARIGILTSGGDCAGLNAVIRAVTFRAVRTYGWDVIGIARRPTPLQHARYQHLSVDLGDLNTASQAIEARIAPLLAVLATSLDPQRPLLSGMAGGLPGQGRSSVRAFRCRGGSPPPPR